VIAIGHDHEAFDQGQARQELLEDRNEGEIEEDEPVLGMVDDVVELVGKEPGVEGVHDGTKAHQPVPDFEVTMGIPGHGGHDLAFAEAQTRAGGAGKAPGPAVEIAIGIAVDRSFNRAGDDLSFAMPSTGMVENGVNQQRPVLHQSVHRTLR
jgi:hypothetical protein